MQDNLEAINIAHAVAASQGFYSQHAEVQTAIAHAYNAKDWNEARTKAQGGNKEVQELRTQVKALLLIPT